MSILLVTKPMAPPWHDSSSQLARAFAVGLQGLEKPLHLRLMSTQHGSDISGVEDEVIYNFYQTNKISENLRKNKILEIFRKFKI